MCSCCCVVLVRHVVLIHQLHVHVNKLYLMHAEFSYSLFAVTPLV